MLEDKGYTRKDFEKITNSNLYKDLCFILIDVEEYLETFDFGEDDSILLRKDGSGICTNSNLCYIKEYVEEYTRTLEELLNNNELIGDLDKDYVKIFVLYSTFFRRND
jgi:hypothetical protein